MDDTSDATAHDTACDQVIGRGCDLFMGDVRSPCGPQPTPPTDSSDTAVSGTIRGGGVGSACSMTDAATSSALWLALLLMVALRRRSWVVLALLFVAQGARAGADAQRHQQGEAASWAALHPADLGPKWGVHLATGCTSAKDPVVLSTELGEIGLLNAVTTCTAAGALRLGQGVQVGGAAPVHVRSQWLGDANAPALGDVRLWVAIPVVEADGGSLRAAWKVRMDLATGASDHYLGNQNGALLGVLAVEKVLPNELVGGFNVGMSLQSPTQLPGAVWANQLVYGAGLRGELRFVGRVAGELVGSANLGALGAPASWPLDAYLSAEVPLPLPHVALRVGVGAGLTHGLGSASRRGFVALQRSEHSWPDTDGDGVPDPRDLCLRVPEDLDGFRDQDGCPDLDNDNDTLPDDVDACPNEPEVFNGFQDLDGCPDLLHNVDITVVSSDPERLELATVQVDDRKPAGLMPGDHLALTTSGDLLYLQVAAAGHELWQGDVVLTQADTDVRVVLTPRYVGSLEITLADPADNALSGWVQLGDARTIVGADGLTLDDVVAGPRALVVGAEAYRRRELPVDVPIDGLLRVHAQLEPAILTLTRDAIELVEELRFDLDSADPVEASLPALEAIAALMRSNQGIELVWVEGHADGSGSSRHNLELSRRRANAVVERLVALGVEGDRLEAVGTGEASASDAGSRRRAVTFLVLVWSDDDALPPLLAPQP